MKMFPVIISVLMAWVMVVCAREVVAEDLVQRDYAISDIAAVEVHGGGEMTIAIGDQETLQITAPRSVLERMKVDGKGSTLRIRQKGQWFWQHDESHATYVLTVKSLQALEATGALAIAVQDAVRADKFVIRTTGASGLTFEQPVVVQQMDVRMTGAGGLHIPTLNADSLEIHANGAADISAGGEVITQELHFNGASEYQAAELASKQVTLKFAGASEATIQVSDSLKATMSGASTVRYLGNPSIEKQLAGPSELVSIQK